MKRYRAPGVLAGLAWGVLAGHAFAAPTVVETVVLGPFTGHDAKLHPDNVAPLQIEYYGTDLGFSYEHAGKIHFLFGDTWATEAYAPIQKSTGNRFDDGFGTIELSTYPDPSRFAPGNVPLIELGQNAGTTEMSAIDPGVVMDLGKTPLAGFSNGSREFAIFNTTKALGCRADADCGTGFACDTGLGFLGVPYTQEESLTLPCIDGEPACTADTMKDSVGAALAGSGFCIDRTSSIWADTAAGRLSATVFQQRVGLRSLADPRQYTDIQRWPSNKFVNVIARTVNEFQPPEGTGRVRSDYRAAAGTGRAQRVLLWGRPGFIGVGAKQRTLGVYFAYVDLPAGPGFSWTPRYFTGTAANGAPRFSAHEADAVALDLDASATGIQSAETYDIVNQMSVAWVAPLKKWVMFYGGGLTKLPSPALRNCGVLELFAGRECKDVVMGNGAVRMRTADNPWGPWTPPQDVIVGGDASVPGSGQFGVGGVLHHPSCTAAGCATHSRTSFYHADEYGFLYAANIIDPWIRPAGGGVDVIWNASTWDPYRVVLLRTRIRP